MVTDDIFTPGEGRIRDDYTYLPKITMTTIRAMPERCIQANSGQGGVMKIAVFTGIATGKKQTEQVRTGKVFFALTGEFAAVRFDDDGKPEAIFKSDTIFLPIAHDAMIARLERQGRLQFALDFSSRPADNKAGYIWSYRNLAKLDRNNLSWIDRITIESARDSQPK